MQHACSSQRSIMEVHKCILRSLTPARQHNLQQAVPSAAVNFHLTSHDNHTSMCMPHITAKSTQGTHHGAPAQAASVKTVLHRQDLALGPALALTTLQHFSSNRVYTRPCIHTYDVSMPWVPCRKFLLKTHAPSLRVPDPQVQ